MERSLELGNSKQEGKTKRKEWCWLNAGAKFWRDIGSSDDKNNSSIKKFIRDKKNFKALLWTSSSSLY